MMMADESAKRWSPEKLPEPGGGEAEASEIPSERDLDLEMVWSLLSDNDSDPAQGKKKGVPVPLDEVTIHTKTKKHDGKTWVDPGHAELQATMADKNPSSGKAISTSDTSSSNNSPHLAFTTISNIKLHIPVQLSLSEPNYKKWSRLFRLLILRFNLKGFIDGTTIASSADDAEWYQFDALIQGWILSTITDEVSDLVLANNLSAHALWKAIYNLFHDNKHARAMQLEHRFRTTVKGMLKHGDGKIFPSMGKQSLSQTNFQNHAKQRWEVLPIDVKALVQHYHKAECPYPAMGSFTHRWEPSDGKAKPSMGSLFPLVVRRKGIFLRVEVLECGISEQGIGEGQSTTRPPLFDGTNYTYWNERMRIYIRSTNFQLWLVIKNGEEVPMKKVGDKLIPKTEDEFDAEDIKKVENYAKAINMLYCAVNPDDYRKISCCSTAKEMWDKLEVTYEGTDQVREAKVDFLTQEYEMFRMKEHEKIDDMSVRFSKIVNDLHALKKTYTDRDLVRKILRSLTSEWRSKADAIYESIGTSNVTIDSLRGNLKIYESTILNPSLNDQRKGIALKASKEPTMNDSSDEDEVKLIMKKFCKLLKKEKAEDGPVCYGCGEAGHIKNKCPRNGRNARHFKKQRAYISWGGDSGDESSEQEEDEEANLCLIAQEEEESANDENQEKGRERETVKKMATTGEPEREGAKKVAMSMTKIPYARTWFK
ncbi:unnamed protein product [Cuscuta campestris]|uniref:CCHC-type domain-containing protein n=1 Tax=Cuscuta campestris TaxID=132261 RepID=A0A484L6T2_9ASTE|nr:unnamed protein product [Cuscuta campestris]